jgi:hypothetical protein
MDKRDNLPREGFLPVCVGKQMVNAEAKRSDGWEIPVNSGGGWKNEERTPNTTDFFSFNCMRPGRHLSSWSCMHST